MMQDLHFLRPEWFLALIPLGLLLWRLARRSAGAGSWRAACDPALLPYLLEKGEGGRSRWGLFGIGLAGLLGITALAGPAWQQLPQPVFQSNTALVIALDLSRSMNATDITPSRLTRARFELQDILRQRREGQTALLVYAASPFVVTPLTTDTATIASQVSALDTGLMPSQGTRPDLALDKALQLLKQAGTSRGEVLFITDGLGDTAPEALLRARPHWVGISVLAVGTREGAPVPREDGGFLTDSKGEIVMPKLEAEPLKRLAAEGGGRYAELKPGDQDTRHLLEPLEQTADEDATEQQGLLTERWREEGPWLVLALLPLAALGFRRGLLVLPLALLLPLPEPALALDWPDLWQRPDQQGAQALEQGDPARAAELFHAPEWQAAARYKAGDYEQALELLKGREDAEGLYNRGNALARMGRLPEAKAAYQEALKKDPDHADAQHNLDLVEEQLQPPEQQPMSGGDSQDSPQQEPEGQQGQSQPQEGDSEQQEQGQNQPQQGGQNPKNAPQQQDPDQAQPEQDQQQAQAADQQEAEGQGDQQQGMQPEQQPAPEPGDEEQPARPTEQSDQPEQPEQEPEQTPAAPAQPGEADNPMSEQERATEQWLRRIPDDPAGLLRRKFQYQYQRMHRGETEDKPW